MVKTADLWGTCPFVTTQKLLQGKWSILILHHLSTGTKRFNALQKEMEDVTQVTLTKHLRFLEQEGLVHREVYPEVPPRVEYSLTPIGQEFSEVLDSIESWGEKYILFLDEKDEG